MRTRTKRMALAVVIAVGAGLVGYETARGVEGGTVTGKVTTPGAQYLGETVVHLVKVPGTYTPKTHVMTQKALHFHPHVLAITFGDTVKWENRDHVGHNVFSPDHEGYNLGVWTFGQSKRYTFDKHTGAYTQKCSVHPNMLAYVFVNQNPYQAVVSEDGSYTLSGVPPGTYQLAVWNSHFQAAPQQVTVKAGQRGAGDFALKP